MKIHRVVQMLGATTSTGKLASDMYDLNNKTYYSEAEQRDIPISHMDFQHMVRAFIKLCEQEEMLDRSKHMGKVVDVIKAKDKIIKKLQDNLKGGFKQSVDDLDVIKKLEEKIKDLEARDVIQYHELHAKINKLEELLEEQQDLLSKEIKAKNTWRDAYYQECHTQGDRYMFSEIPNDTDGQEFVDHMKKHLNKESYKMRVRGQHIKPELKGTGATYWGQGINESTHLRVYIDKK